MANDIVGAPDQIIADLRRELALRTAERDEALAQQTATAEVLQVINASPGDLAPVFDAMLEKAMRLCDATYGHVYTYDGRRYHPVAVHAQAEFVKWRLERGSFETGGTEAPLDQLVAGAPIVAVDDAPNSEGYRESRGFRSLVDASGIRSGVTVALRKDAALLGAITVYRQEVRPFTDKQIALLENFAAQAVIAMENARLITETREALEQQTAIAEVLQVINSSPGDLAPVFEAMLNKALTLSGAAFGALMSYDGEHVRAVSTRGFPPELVELFARPFVAAHTRYGSGGRARVACVAPPCPSRDRGCADRPRTSPPQGRNPAWVHVVLPPGSPAVFQ
jgi:transcriptional regulator with GAF, ATPase, and Fis domain